MTVSDMWSTPLTSPLYQPFPIEYKSVSILSVVYRTKTGVIQADLPEGVQSTSDLIMIHCYDMPDVQGMGRVSEANVMVGVETHFGGNTIVGGFSTNLIISSDVGLAQGREVHGQPKKLGKINLDVRGDTVVAEIWRNDIRALRATTPYKFQRAEVTELERVFDFKRNINHKVVPNIDGSLGMNQITSRILKDVEVLDFWIGPVTVELAPHIQVPLHRHAVVEPLFACYWTANFTLQPGEILHDYLAAQ